MYWWCVVLGLLAALCASDITKMRMMYQYQPFQLEAVTVVITTESQKWTTVHIEKTLIKPSGYLKHKGHTQIKFYFILYVHKNMRNDLCQKLHKGVGKLTFLDCDRSWRSVVEWPNHPAHPGYINSQKGWCSQLGSAVWMSNILIGIFLGWLIVSNESY